MALKCSVSMSLTLYNRYSGTPIEIGKEVSREFTEDSEEYKKYIDEYIKRTGNGPGKTEKEKNDFDREFLEYFNDYLLIGLKETAKTIEKVIKECYIEGKKAYFSWGGTIVNPADFCAITINNYKSNVTKTK